MTNIKFAVIGTGGMAARMLLAFAKLGLCVTVVASRNPERAVRFAKAFAIPATETDVDAVCARSDVDVLYIANASQHHAMTCVAALEAGKAVLCEKPIALSEAEAHQVVLAARRTKTLCMEGLWTLLLPAYQRFIALSRTQELGLAKNLVADFGYRVGDEREQRLHAKERGGVLLDRGIYLIALALSVLGPVERIDAQLDYDDLGVDRDVFLLLQHRGGGHSQLAASFGCLMSNTATLSLSRGFMRLESPLIGSEAISTISHGAATISGWDVAQPSLRAKIIARLRESPRLRRINRAIKPPAFRNLPFGANPYLAQLDHFVALLKAGARESDIVPLDLSLEIHRIIARAHLASASPAREETRS